MPSCRGTYVSQFGTPDSCQSDFGAPASDQSRFVQAEQSSLIAALQNPRLQEYDCYCLQTNPLCGGTSQVAYLCVGRQAKCQPELIPVALVTGEVANSCRPCDGLVQDILSYLSDHPTSSVEEWEITFGSEILEKIQLFMWDNSRGAFVDPAKNCVIEKSGNLRQLPVLRADRSRLTCVIYNAGRNHRTGCCSSRRDCIWYAQQLESCAPCCPTIRGDYSCCPSNSCDDTSATAEG